MGMHFDELLLLGSGLGFMLGDEDRGFRPTTEIKMTPAGENLETSLFESLKTDLYPQNLASKFIGDAKKLVQQRKRIASKVIASRTTNAKDVISGDMAKALLQETSATFQGATQGPTALAASKRKFALDRFGKLQNFINLQSNAPILKAESELLAGEFEQAAGARKGAKIGTLAQLGALQATRG